MIKKEKGFSQANKRGLDFRNIIKWVLIGGAILLVLVLAYSLISSSGSSEKTNIYSNACKDEKYKDSLMCHCEKSENKDSFMCEYAGFIINSQKNSYLKDDFCTKNKDSDLCKLISGNLNASQKNLLCAKEEYKNEFFCVASKTVWEKISSGEQFIWNKILGFNQGKRFFEGLWVGFIAGIIVQLFGFLQSGGVIPFLRLGKKTKGNMLVRWPRIAGFCLAYGIVLGTILSIPILNTIFGIITFYDLAPTIVKPFLAALPWIIPTTFIHLYFSIKSKIAAEKAQIGAQRTATGLRAATMFGRQLERASG